MEGTILNRRQVLRATGTTVAGLLATAGGAGGTGGDPTPTVTPQPTARPSDYGPLGFVHVPDAKEAVVGESGEFVYVAVGDGFAVVDVSSPSDPAVVHEIQSVAADRAERPMNDIYDLKVDGDRLAVVGPESTPEDPSGFVGLVVYDVSSPASPERIVARETDFGMHNCFIEDGVVYLCKNHQTSAASQVGRNELVTVDAASGEELGRWSIVLEEPMWREVVDSLWYLHDVWVQNDRAYLAHWEAGTWILDVSDPTSPSYVGHVRGSDPERWAGLSREDEAESRRLSKAMYEPPGNDHYTTLDESGGLLGVGAEAGDMDPDDETGGGGSVHLYTTHGSGPPDQVAEIEPPPTDFQSMLGTWTTSHNFGIQDGHLFTSWYRGGVRVHDVSDPAAPTELAAWRASDRASFWTAQPATEEFFVASSLTGQSSPSAGDQPGMGLYTFPVPPRATPSPTPTPTATKSASPATETTTGSGPGLGVPAAVGGLVGAGAAALWRCGRVEEE